MIALVGLVPILVAAELGTWQLGEWSRDVSPLPFFAAVALATAALVLRPPTLWFRAAAVAAGVALALLGDSGLALALAAVPAALLTTLTAVERRRGATFTHKQAKGHP